MAGISRRDFLDGCAAATVAALAGGLDACTAGAGDAASGSGADLGTGHGTPGATPSASHGSRGPNSLPDPARAPGVADETLPFDHVVVVMMENHSFDNYFGMLPRRGQPQADGFRFDALGKPLDYNPLDGGYQRAFQMPGTCQPGPGNVTQAWTPTHAQVNGGLMNGFAGTSNMAMGYFDASDLPFYYAFAKAFCLGNRCFCSAPCQTYPNRRYLYAATSQGLISTDAKSFSMPPPPNGTLMDRMTQYGVSWRSYFTDLPALAIVPQTLEDHPLNFSPIAQFYTDCLLGTLPAVSYVDPEFNLIGTVGGPLFAALNPLVGKIRGLPPEVAALVTGLGADLNAQGASEENPDDVRIGEVFVASVVNAVMASPLWPRTLLIWNYDEHGGYYDHVPPAPAIEPDDLQPILGPKDAPGAFNVTGPRVPFVVASPYSKPGGVTDVVHDHTSIIATIAQKWNLPALTYRDAQATPLLDFLDLDSPPAWLTPPKLVAAPVPSLGLSGCPTVAPAPVILSAPPW